MRLTKLLIQLPNECAPEGTQPVQYVASSLNLPKVVAEVMDKNSIDQTKAGNSNGAAYYYEMDCVRVADSINVIDLVSAIFRFKFE